MNPYTLTPKRLLSLLLAMVLLLPGVLFAQDTEEDEEELEELETFAFTGSRIARIDVEPVSPVLTISSESLEDTGFATVGDQLRSLSFNNGQALTPDNAGTSFTPGVSAINLRGLGNNNSLVLLNGRRTAPYASPGFNGLQTVFDLNSIPNSAIASVEILKDGGSALYGSDAVSGVIDIKLRQDYEGMSVGGRVGDMFDTGATYRSLNFTVGANSARSSVFTTFNWEKYDSVYARDLAFSDNADQNDRAAGASPFWTVLGEYPMEFRGSGDIVNNQTEYLEYLLGSTNPVDALMFDNRSSRGFPGFLSFPDVGNRTFDMPTDNPTLDTVSTQITSHPYNYQELAQLFPAVERFSFFTRGTYQINEYIEAYAEISFSRVESVVDAAAPPVDIENSVGFRGESPDGTQNSIAMVMPAHNPFNPWDVDIFAGRRRLVELANRSNNVQSDTPRIVAGLKGELFGMGDWKWDSAFLYSKNTVTNVTLTGFDYRLQEALYGLTRNGDGSLTWDPTTPRDERVYFNWFGMNEPAMAEHIADYNINDDSYEMWSVDGSVTGTVTDLPGGPLGAAFGFEYRAESLFAIATPLNIDGNILAGGQGDNAIGDRTVTSFYAEFAVPIVADLIEAQVAARYEDYSDEGFQDEARPKLGVKVTPFPWIAFRASYSESFKAPDLAFLYNASSRSFTSNQLIDPVTGTEIDQLQIVTAGNPDLEPELTDTIFFGVTFEPGEHLFDGLLDGLLFRAEYYNYDRTNLLAQLSDIFSYTDFIAGAAENPPNPTFAGKVVRSPVTDEILFIRDDYSNINSAELTAWDFAVSYTYETATLGRFYIDWQTTWFDEYLIDGDDVIGGYLNPEFRHTATLSWNRDDWGASLFGIYIDERSRTLNFGSQFRDGDTLLLTYTPDAQIVLNASVSYRGFYDTNITVGINNLLNEEPPVDPWDGLGATGGVNYLAPAQWFVSVQKEF